jgi:hypothetical protein
MKLIGLLLLFVFSPGVATPADFLNAVDARRSNIYWAQVLATPITRGKRSVNETVTITN